MEWTAVSPPCWVLDPCMRGENLAPAVHSFLYFHLPRPSLPPCCRFYELPWALIHLCHTQAPLLWLLTNWLGCRWEGPAGHILFLQPGQRATSPSAITWGHLGVGKTMCSARLLKKKNLKKQVSRVWESSCGRCVGLLKLKEVLEVVWSLGI